MTSSGRCHGPGCTQEAKTEFWCSESCQEAWDRQLADVPTHAGTVGRAEVIFDGQPIVGEWTVRVAINGHLSEGSASTLTEATDRAAEMVSEMFPQAASIPDPERGRCYCGQIPDGGGGHLPGIPGCIPELTCGCSDPERGWLARTLDRLFGRTT